MLRFKARRKSPALKPRGELTPSERRVIRIMDEAMQELRREVTRMQTRLADAVAHKSADQVANMISTEAWLDIQEPLQAELLAELLDAGSRVQLPPIRKAVMNFSFDRSRDESARWAANEAGQLIREISDGQREMVKDLISRAQLSGISPGDVAREIRNGIGLTSAQAGWVSNFYERNLTANIANGMSAAAAADKAQAAADRYQTQVHRYRANTIARTEIMRANSEGRKEAWGQGVEGGWIDAGAQKEWIAEADACEICEPLSGMRVPLNEEFPEGDPPAHPNCRCDLLLVDEVPQDIRDMTDEELDAEIASLMDAETAPAPVTTTEPDREVISGIPANTGPGDIGGTRVTEPMLAERYDGFTPTQAQIDAVEGYQLKDFYRINEGLRQGNLDDRFTDTVRELDNLFDEAPRFNVQTGEYFRTTESSVLSGLKRGDVFIDDGYLSTSITRTQALEFAEQSAYDAKIRILDVSNSPKIWVDGISEVGSGASQGEVIFQRGTPLQYLGKDKQGWHVFTTARYR